MNIIKGTFRLSILVGIAVFAIQYWRASQEAHASAWKNSQIYMTLRCARDRVGVDNTAIKNEFGLLDLSKVHCSKERFFAHEHEIASALEREDPYVASYDSEMSWRRPLTYMDGVAAFVVTNLLGLGFLGARRAFRWVMAGYRV